MPDILVFDLFGTLVFFDDSRVPTVEREGRRVPMTLRDLPALLLRWLPGVEERDFLRELRRISAEVADEKRKAGIELNSSVRFERTLRHFGCDAERARAAAVELASVHMDSLARAVVCPDDRREILGELASRHRLALVSNFDCARTGRRVLAEAGIAGFFEVTVISDEEGLRKPSAELFHRACSRLEARPEDCYYIGDTLLEDIEGASAAGLTPLWIHADREAVSPAAAVLADVRELPAWLAARK